jgi:hypothetical protein
MRHERLVQGIPRSQDRFDLKMIRAKKPAVQTAGFSKPMGSIGISQSTPSTIAPTKANARYAVTTLS